MDRIILHADMDAFYASVEQRDDPSLKGKPVIVGWDPGQRGVVATCSYEARPFGVRSAMPSARAKRLCPQAVWIPPRMKAYSEEAGKIRAILDRFTPLVEPLSLDEAFLDLTQPKRPFDQGVALARRIKKAVRDERDLTVSVGVACSKFVAKVASDLEKPDGLVAVPPGTETAFLAPLPASSLWGAGPVAQKKFAEMGIGTIGRVRALPEERLARAFGKALGRHFFLLARGIDDRPVVPEAAAKSLGHETTFEKDLSSRERCHGVLLELSEEVGRRLRKESLSGRVVAIKVRFADFTTLSRQETLASPTHDDGTIYRTAKGLFDVLLPRMRAVRLLGVSVGGVVRGAVEVQPELFEAPPEKTERLSRAIDRIRRRYGVGALRRGRPADRSAP